jgi:hypothetical protein
MERSSLTGDSRLCRRPCGASAARVAGLLATLFVTALASTANAAPETGSETVVSGPGFDYRIEVRPLANLTYQLQCIAGLLHCSKPVYEDLWKKQLGWSADDDAQMARLRRLRDRLGSVRLPLAAEGAQDGPRAPRATYPLPDRESDLWTKARLACLQARSLPDLEERLLLLTSLDEAQALTGIVGHFWKRFQPFWRKERAPLARFGADLGRALGQRELSQLVLRVARFYGAATSGNRQTTLRFMLVARPEHASKHTNAEQLESTSVIEVVGGERPVNRLPIVLHELFHYFYASASDADHRAVLEAFLRSSVPGALSGYNLLNEALATALGNGVVRRHLEPERYAKGWQRPQFFYDDPAIDSSARALVDEMERGLARGARITGADFVPTYLAALQRALGASLLRPELALRVNAFVFEAPLGRLKRHLSRRVRVQSSHGYWPLDARSTRQSFDRHPDLSGGMLLLKAHLPRLSRWEHVVPPAAAADVRRLAGLHRGFVYALPRGAHARLYLVVADDEATMTTLLDRLAAAPAPWLGAGLSVP